jgi:hypothetical protein
VALNVPYFKQTMLGSCGPACVVMVRSWIDGTPVVRARSDIIPWFHSWVFPFGMTESSGLAKLLHDFGARVSVLKERPKFRFRPATGTTFDIVGRAFGYLAIPGARIREWQARRRGIRASIQPLSVDRLQHPDALGRPAIVMVNQGSYAPDPEFPSGVLHWVVVTDVGDGAIQFHDPDLGPNQRLSQADFDRAMDVTPFGIDRQLILVERLPPRN